jgi:hypothetical protein
MHFQIAKTQISKQTLCNRFFTSNILIQASKEMVHRESWIVEHFGVNFGIFHCHPNLGTIKQTFYSEKQGYMNLLYFQTSSDKLKETDL